MAACPAAGAADKRGSRSWCGSGRGPVARGEPADDAESGSAHQASTPPQAPPSTTSPASASSLSRAVAAGTPSEDSCPTHAPGRILPAARDLVDLSDQGMPHALPAVVGVQR